MTVLAFLMHLQNRFVNNHLFFIIQKYVSNGILAALATSCNPLISCSEAAVERLDVGRQRKQLEMRLTCIYSRRGN